MLTFGQTVGTAGHLQGAKSVYGMVEGSYLGFGSAGSAQKAAARAADGACFVIAIGALSATPSCRGRVVNLVKLRGDHIFLTEEIMPAHHWLALKDRWPHAAVLSDVFAIEDCPDLLHLGFHDRSIMKRNRRGVTGTAADMQILFESLKEKIVLKLPVPIAGDV